MNADASFFIFQAVSHHKNISLQGKNEEKSELGATFMPYACV
jgi:hypothetical protein